MVKTLPTIRAANLLPIVRWMEANNRQTQRNLEGVGLGCWFNLAPEDPVPVVNAIAFLRQAARTEGPDLPCRIVTSASLGELAYIGRVALGARTPREALTRVSLAMPMHSSHEDLRISDKDGDLVVTETWRIQIDDESLHQIHCMLASMLQQLCLFSSVKLPSLQRVRVNPHPEFGIEHLKPWFGDRVEATDTHEFLAQVKGEVADRSFRVIAKDRMTRLAQMNVPPLAEDKSLAGSIRPVLASLLHGGEPSINCIAASTGLSVRTLQRRLAEEGTSFSAELETVRERLARSLLVEPSTAIRAVSERLGYSSQSALTRAVRRMTKQTPASIGRVRQG